MGITAIKLAAVTILAVLFSLLAISSIRLAGIDHKKFQQRINPKILLIAAVFNLLFIITVTLIYRFWDQQPIKSLGFATPPKDLVFGFLALALSTGLAWVYVSFLHSRGKISFTFTQESKGHFREVGFWLGLLVLLIAALQEEIVFRGYFTYELMPYGGWFAAIVSSLVFTAWHFLSNKANLFQTLDWILGGFMLFYVYRFSGSIGVATLVHFSRNLANILIFNIAGNGLLAYHKELKPAHKTIFMLCHSAILICCCYLYYVKN